MTERKTVYHDANGVRRTLIADDERPEVFHVKTSQDVEPVLDGVARDRELMPHNGTNKLVARLPVEVFERAIHQHWDESDWKRYLNSAEAAPFRIWRGNV
jgi:hypothetical protein